MEDYLNILKSSINEKKLSSFFVLIPPEGLNSFKIIKKPLNELQNKFKKNLQKYKNNKLAHISLIFNSKKKFVPSDWVFSIKIIIYIINDKGDINTSIHDSWSFMLNYNENDINTHHFKLKDVEKLINLVSEKILITGINGIFYDDFLIKIAKIKKRLQK
jgi:hypothetical protein